MIKKGSIYASKRNWEDVKRVYLDKDYQVAGSPHRYPAIVESVTKAVETRIIHVHFVK